MDKPERYADVCDERPDEYSNFEEFEPDWGDPANYETLNAIGRGRYSLVFDGRNKKSGQRCVIKVLKPVKKLKINREIKILQALSGGPNIIQLYDIMRDPETKIPALAFEYVNNQSHKTLYPTLGDLDIRCYIYQVLKGLEYCHSQGVMHRDIKPHNLVIDHHAKTLKIIDWGLAEFYHYGQQYNVRVASRYYKGPELLVGYKSYNYSLDIWSLGVMMAGMIFKKEPFFRGEDNYDQLIKIAKVLGTEELLEYYDTYNIKMDPYYKQRLKRWEKIPFVRYINSENQTLVSEEAIDLLEKMLVYDHAKRILPCEAMKHPYFKPILEHPDYEFLKSYEGSILG